MAEYLRRAGITAARQREIYAIVTNSDGDLTRRAELLEAMGPDVVERVIDPGEDVIEQRLSRRTGGRLSAQCRQAKNRWYRRLRR